MKATYKDRPVELEICLAGSAVDSYVASGYYLDGEMEDLKESELDECQDLWQDEIQEYARENGSSSD